MIWECARPAHIAGPELLILKPIWSFVRPFQAPVGAVPGIAQPIPGIGEAFLGIVQLNTATGGPE